MSKNNKNYIVLNKKDYNKGVSDSLKILYNHINSMDYAIGFAASKLAQDHSNMLKTLYNSIHTLIEKKDKQLNES